MLGFSSTHRSGKTTTAQIVAQRLKVPFVDGSFGRLAQRLGYNSVAAMTVEARIDMQERCLALHMADLRVLPRPAIIDRTPLDYLAYAMADVGMHAGLDATVSRRIHAYAENCIAVTREHYGAIAVLEALPAYTEEAGKPPPCLAYQSHIQFLIQAAARTVTDTMPVGFITGSFDLEERVHAASEFFSAVIEQLGAAHAAEQVH